MSQSFAISGYATIDYSVQAPRALHGPGTYPVVALANEHWAKPGGAAFYASARMAAGGHQAHPIVMLGEDSNAQLYLDACDSAHVSTSGIHRTDRIRTPWCFLMYHDDGSHTCLLDAGSVMTAPLNQRQLEIVARADRVCIAAGSVAATEQILAAIDGSTQLAWIAKQDELCFPDALAARLAQRADLVFCNRSERALVDGARAPGHRKNQTIIETRGAQGVLIESNGTQSELSSEPLTVNDTTGAGDTLAGEVMASLLSGCSIEVAVRRGMDAARALLSSRV